MNTISKCPTIRRLIINTLNFERHCILALAARKRGDLHFSRFWARFARQDFQLMNNYALAIQDRMVK